MFLELAGLNWVGYTNHRFVKSVCQCFAVKTLEVFDEKINKDPRDSLVRKISAAEIKMRERERERKRERERVSVKDRGLEMNQEIKGSTKDF